MNTEFNLERAIAGEPIETVSGTPVEFVAYRPTAKTGEQLIVQDGGDIRTYHSNGRYIGPAISNHFDLRMKSVVKQIDWAKLPVDTLIILGIYAGGDKRYFSSFTSGLVHCYRFGMTSKTMTNTSDIFQMNPSNVHIAPDQPWTVWLGGACPIPDGLEYEVEFRGKGIATQIDLKTSNVDWEHGGDFLDIIAYRLTGKVLDGWKL
jgi:hypothetical protein